MSWQPPDTDPSPAPGSPAEPTAEPGANGPSILWAAPIPTVQAEVEVPGAPGLVFLVGR